VRARNSVLEALEYFRDMHPGISIGNMIAFLYACENEGLTILDLAHVSGFYLATASRAIRAFSEPDAEGAMPPALGLIELTSSPRGKVIQLTAAGRRVRAHLDSIIADAAPIHVAAAE
jgi:hypothetical protein